MSEKKIQLVVCTDGIFPDAVGGMQRHSRLLIEELARYSDLEIIVIHPHEGKKIFDTALGITEFGLHAKKTKNQKEYLQNAWCYSKEVHEILKKFPGSVIYSQGMSVWYGIKDFKERLIVNPHGLEPYQTLTMKERVITYPYRVIHNYIFKQAGKIISLGGRLTDILIRTLNIPAKKIVVLPNAVNLPQPVERKFSNNPVQLLFVGRFAFNKGIDVLTKAAMELNAEGFSSALRFVLVGKGDLYEKYSNSCKAVNIRFYHGADDETLFSLYRQSDVFVLPTLFEGMPTVVLEAMGYGLPIIVTDTGATKEQVDDSNGFIIEKKNVQSLKDAIKKYIALSEQEKKSLSEASYQKVKQKFTWQHVAQKHVELFKEINRQLND